MVSVRNLKRNITSAKIEKSANKSLSQPGCSHSDTIYNLQLQKTIVLRMQPRHPATWRSHSNAICKHKFNKRIELRTGTTIVAKHIERTKRPQPHLPHTRGTSNRRLQPLHTEKHKVSCSGFLPTTHGMQHSCSHSNAICNHSFEKRIELLHTGTAIVAKHIEGTKRPQPHPPHTRGTFHRRLQPLYTEKHKVSCSGFLPKTNNILPHHFPSSPLPFLTTSHRHHVPSSPLPIVTTSLPHHFPSSPLLFLTTSFPHHFPSSPPPFLTTSQSHHFPSSPPCLIVSYSFVMYCYCIYCDVMYHPSS